MLYRFYINGNYTGCLKEKWGLRQEDPISPMLFVVIMEYFIKILMKMSKNPNFNYHSKCEKLSLINMSFVDDFLLFARGDTAYVQLTM